MEDKEYISEQKPLPYEFKLDTYDMKQVNALPPSSVRQSCCFYRLDELMYEGKNPQREAFINVLAALNQPGFNFVYIIRGDRNGTHIYLGVAAKPGSSEAQRVSDFSIDVLQPSFESNFRGSRLTRLFESEFSSEIMEPRRSMPYSSMVMGIPSLKDQRGRQEGEPDFQGIDRLASAMHGETWQMVIVCEPLRRHDITVMRQEVYKIYETLSLLAKNSVQSQRGTGESTGTSEGRSKGTGTTRTKGDSTTVTEGKSKSTSFTEGSTTSRSSSHSESSSNSHAESHSQGSALSWGTSQSNTSGTNRSKGTSNSKTSGKNNSSSSSSETGGESISEGNSNSNTSGENKGGSKNEGSSSSDTNGSSKSDGTTNTEGKSDSTQTGTGTSSSKSVGTSVSESSTENASENYGKSTGKNTSNTLSATVEVVRKKEAEEIKYIDESLLPRFQSGESRGMFKTAVFLYAKSPSILNRLQSNIRAIFQSGQGNFSPLTVEPLADEASWMDDFQIHSIYSPETSEQASFFGVTALKGRLDLATCLTLQEISLIAGMPQHEVPGLALTPYTPFGLNTTAPADEGFSIGHLVYGGQALADNPVLLDRNVLNKHVFVTGITGSGKTMTCKQLLSSSGMNFLVIEPAKTEYRELTLLKGLEDTIVFSVGDESRMPLRFNPFELLDGENFTSHIDMVKAAFASSFEFEASMPQIFEMAIYRAYAACGWDTGTGEFSGDGEKVYPTLTEFLGKLDDVVKEQKFGPELEGNYRGSLISRIKNLTYGAKGKMLDCRKSVDFPELLHHHVVLEMEELKSPQDKALIMALVMGRLAEAVKIEYRKDRSFRHITLVEEAHRLLTKVMPGDSDTQKFSVGVFTDMLAEIRKYGESLIIVDQIPNKLSEDVLKNTATKIVHKLLARDDKEVIGDTMMLSDAQKTFLSNLRTGQAIVFTENWSKAVCVQIGTIENAHKPDELEQMMGGNGESYKVGHIMAYYPELGPGASLEELDYYQKAKHRWPKLFPALREILGRWGKDPEKQAEALSLLPPPEEATPELVSLCARLFYENAPKKLTDLDTEGLKSVIKELLMRKSEDEIEASHHNELRQYRRLYLDYFSGMGEK